MSRNWTLIRKQKAWGDVLAELIAETKAAIKSGAAERSNVRADLREFIDQSPNFDDAVPIDKYDEIAAKLHKQSVQADLEDELARQEGRTPDFAAILKQVRAITDAANAAAESISLNRVRKVVDSLVDAVDSLKDVRKSMAASDEPTLAKSLDDLLEAFEAVRTAVKG
jgi:hypothetical protein